MSGILSVLIVVSIIRFNALHQANQNYEAYISYEIANQLGMLLPAIADNEAIISAMKVDEDTVLSPDQAASLCYNFEMISRASQELRTIASYLDKLDPGDQDLTASLGQDVHFFLARSVLGNGLLGDCSIPETDIVLDDTQMEKLRQIGGINRQWAEAAAKYPQDSMPNGGKLVNEETWVNILRELAVVTADSGWYINKFFN